MLENCCCENCFGCNVFHEYCLDFNGGGWVGGVDNLGRPICPATCLNVTGVKIVSSFSTPAGVCTGTLTEHAPCGSDSHDVPTIYTLTLRKNISAGIVTWTWTVSVQIWNGEVVYFANYWLNPLSHCKDGFVNNKLTLTKVSEGPAGYMWQQFHIAWCAGHLPNTIDVYGKQ